MHKVSGKYLKKYEISLKSIFSTPLYHFQSRFSIIGLRNAILQYNTLSMMCILVTGLEWRPQGGTYNKQRASVRLDWLSWPLTACWLPKYPVSAFVRIVRWFLTLWYIYMHIFSSFFNTKMAQTLLILPLLYHDCWWPGDARSQCINSHNILFLLDHPGLRTTQGWGQFHFFNSIPIQPQFQKWPVEVFREIDYNHNNKRYM